MLIYLPLIRSDIVHVASVDSQFIHCPNEEHMTAVMRILNYLKSSPGKYLISRKYGHLKVKGYTDVGWGENVTDRRSTSRYFMFVVGNLVT